MKRLFFALIMAIPLLTTAADEITLTVSGEGSTQDVAVNNALRNAIEQAYGAFISSNTQILNNKLVKDEIVSLSQGVIKSYNIESSTFIKEKSIFFVAVKATVSMNKMVSFVNDRTSSSVKVNLGVFDANVRLAKLNADAEIRIIENMVKFISTVPNLWSYRLELLTPHVDKADNSMYEIDAYVHVLKNDNTKKILNLVRQTLESISLTQSEIDNYKTWGIPCYSVDGHQYGLGTLYFRNKNLPCFFTGKINFLGEPDRDDPYRLSEDVFLLYAVYGFDIFDNVNRPSKRCFRNVKSMLNVRRTGTPFKLFYNHGKELVLSWGKYNSDRFWSYINKVDQYKESLREYNRSLFSQTDEVVCLIVSISVPQKDASKYSTFEILPKQIKVIDVTRFFDNRYKNIKY